MTFKSSNKNVIQVNEKAEYGDKSDSGSIIYNKAVLQIKKTGKTTIYAYVNGVEVDQCSVTVKKAVNKVRAKTYDINVKSKNSKSVEAKKVFKIISGVGKIKYKKVSGDKGVSISSAGNVKIKKDVKRGSYRITVRISAGGDSNYNSGSTKVKFYVKVK